MMNGSSIKRWNVVIKILREEVRVKVLIEGQINRVWWEAFIASPKMDVW